MTVMSALSRETLEFISSWAEVLTAVFGILAATGAVVYLLANRPLKRLEKHDNDLMQANVSEARIAQQRVEIELAKQKERTAKAEDAAANAALALAKFKEPRSLSPEQQTKLIADTKPFASQNFAFAVFPDPEPQALARVIDGLLKSVGWNRVPSQIQRDGGVLMDIAGESAAQISDSGIDVYIAPDDTESIPAQKAICSALMAFHCETHRTPQLAGKTPRAITISVGKKL